MTEWATLVLFILIGTRLPSLMMALLSYLLRPSLLLQPVFDVIQPLRQRLENAYRDVLRHGSFVQHLSGLFNLGRSLAEFTTIPFQVARLAPVRYVRYLLQFFCGSTAYVIVFALPSSARATSDSDRSCLFDRPPKSRLLKMVA